VSKSAIPVADPIAAKIPMKEVISIPLKNTHQQYYLRQGIKNSFKE
tara:strand:+ start:590 stop:727 length:138 start_codon:yes stop_codon:yes gene_type:complete